MNDLHEPLALALADRVNPLFLKMKDSCRHFGVAERTGESLPLWDRAPRIPARLSSTAWRMIKWAGKRLALALLTSTLGAIETQGESQAWEPLITALKDPDPSVRESAAVALGRSGDARAVETLIACLKDQEPSVRAFSAASLGQLGDMRVVEPLLACSTDQFSVVRGSAAAALEQLGDPRALSLLLARLNNRDASAAVELGKSGDARAVDPLMAWFVKDPDQGLSKSSGDALVQLGTLAAEPILETHWEKTKKVLLADLQSDNQRKLENAAYTFISLGAEEIVPRLISVLDEKGDREMAEAYLASGDDRLAHAASSWAAAHGCKISDVTGFQAKWGVWGGWSK